MADLQGIADALIKGDRNTVVELTKQAIDEGVGPGDVLNDGLVAGMSVVGQRFKNNEVYVPEVLIAARAMRGGMEIIAPLLEASGIKPIGKVVLGTVKGDLHDIGKNLVGIMLRGAGFEIVDLGKDVPPEVFIDTAEKEEAGIIGMSTMLTTTAPAMIRVIEILRERGLDGSIKTIVGGAPVSQDLAKEIGADAYGYDATNAVDSVKEMVGP